MEPNLQEYTEVELHKLIERIEEKELKRKASRRDMELGDKARGELLGRTVKARQRTWNKLHNPQQ